MRRMLVALALVTLLGGCSAVTLPPPPTDAEISLIEAKGNVMWWNSMFPNENPQYVPVERRVSPQEHATVITACLQAQDIEGIQFFEGGGWVFDVNDSETVAAFQRIQWTCYQQYPLELTDERRSTYLSKAQLDYVFDYFAARLVPCLRLEGFDVNPMPSRDTFMAESISTPMWNPYYELTPMPNQAGQWVPILSKCPPPPMTPSLIPGPREY
ncbi:MAG: hypothetical protein JWP85_1533 [Rhodoglobus sp.]|nr:hypothetical protein [Rhodoglobus sp.]